LSSAPRIRLGLDAEARGDIKTAEQWLLDAARVDRQYEPAWTLANFYFRQPRQDDFWKWMRTALAVSYGDRRPAFDLCWRTTQDPKEILAQAIPERREVIAAYLTYLIQEKRLDAAAPVASKLANWHRPGDLPLLYAASDAFLNGNQGNAASSLWTALGHPAPSGIFSPDFGNPRIGHGFDWRLIESSGVTHLAEDNPPAHRIIFNGQQPESCELLLQFLALDSGRQYTLQWEARTSGFPAQTGLEWRIGSERGQLAASDEWKSGEFTFTASADWPTLSLTYQRPLGEVRAEGYLEIRHVRIHARIHMVERLE
ncbi:MAG TPA: hypothetical protein VFW83_02785, partial [Bryobacteraceae bacterium]|nr:hypothetical protein [Bryobacteraceae bacterium]